MRKRLGISYEYLFNAVPGHYLVMLGDDPNFTIVEVNNSLCEMVGMTRRQVINKTLLEVFPYSGDQASDEGTDAIIDSIRQCIVTARAHSPNVIRYDILGQDGKFERRLWSTTNFPIIKEGNVVGVILSTDDVTKHYDEAKYVKKRVQYLEHLVEINNSKDEFISIASHQLRTPATAVKQYLGMLHEGFLGSLTSEQNAVLERAIESNERQLRIVTDLLKVAQVDAGKIVFRKEPTDLAQLVHTTIRDNLSLFKKRRQMISFRPTRRIIEATVDTEIIRTVFENILDNASKYTPEGGNIAVDLKDDGDTIWIVVTDEGIGISDKKELFKKFVRIQNELSTKVGGTGLGLYWAKRSINAHGGDITYRPNEPRGSIFEIVLPRKPKDM
ncbi:MAG: ATP-binding protein [Candidatus Saccharimonas aalborgensis]